MYPNLKVSVIGLGHWGPNLVRAFTIPGKSEVVGAIDLDESKIARFRERLPDVPVFSSVEAAENHVEADVWVIATPPGAHAPLVEMALASGKDVFVEKPLAPDARTAARLTHLAHEFSRILMVGHIFRYNLAIQRLKLLVDTNVLGHLWYLRCLRTNLGPIRHDVDALWDLASHDISVSSFLFGALPISVSATSQRLLGSQQADIGNIVLRYPGGRVSHIFASWLDPKKRRELVAVGSNKMATFDDMNPDSPLHVFDRGVDGNGTVPYSDSFDSFRLSIREGATDRIDISTGTPLRTEAEHFVECVRTRTPPLTDGREGLAVVSILEACTDSAHHGGREVAVTYFE